MSVLQNKEKYRLALLYSEKNCGIVDKKHFQNKYLRSNNRFGLNLENRNRKRQRSQSEAIHD